MAKFIQKAVDALHTTFDTKLIAELRDVETQEGLASGELTDPNDVIKVFNPHDNRSPLIMVDDVGMEFDRDVAGQRNNVMGVDCGVMLSFRGGLDREAGKLFVRRYITAMIQTIQNNAVLGGNEAAVIGRIDTATDDAKLSGQDESATRHYALMEVNVRVHSP